VATVSGLRICRRNGQSNNRLERSGATPAAQPERSAYGERRDSLPRRFPELFHECCWCHQIGLRPGILTTRHGEYGMRSAFEAEPELVLNESGLCGECAKRGSPGDNA
jgi:hypothetical protein